MLSALVETAKLLAAEQTRADESKMTHNIDGRKDVEELVERNVHRVQAPAGHAARGSRGGHGGHGGHGDAVSEVRASLYILYFIYFLLKRSLFLGGGGGLRCAMYSTPQHRRLLEICIYFY